MGDKSAVEQGAGVQSTSSKKIDTLTPDEIREGYEVARRPGSRLLEINLERVDEGMDFSFNSEMFPEKSVASVQPKAESEQISQEEIAAATRASFALTLEAARQIKDGDLIRRQGPVNATLENLQALRECFVDGQQLAAKMLATDPEGYNLVAKGVASRVLGKGTDEIQMQPDQVEVWVDGNYDSATGFVNKKYQALESYLS